MASLNLNILRNTNKNKDSYVYADLHLDIETTPNDINGNAVNTTINIRSKDIKVDYDLNAIKNSLINLFNTVPGERVLLPDYGADLRKFVFEPVSQSTGEQLGAYIKTSIQKWEPRVSVASLSIVGYEDTQQYNINLALEVPFISKQQKLTLKGVLNRQGFTF